MPITMTITGTQTQKFKLKAVSILPNKVLIRLLSTFSALNCKPAKEPYYKADY